MSHRELPKGMTRCRRNRERSLGCFWSEGSAGPVPTPGAATPSHFPGQHLHWERVSEHCTGQEHEKPKLCKENIPGTFSGSGSEGTSGSSNCSCKDIEDNVSHVPQTMAVGKDWGWQCPRLPPRLSSESRKRHFICCYSFPKMWISITRTSTPPE